MIPESEFVVSQSQVIETFPSSPNQNGPRLLQEKTDQENIVNCIANLSDIASRSSERIIFENQGSFEEESREQRSLVSQSLLEPSPFHWQPRSPNDVESETEYCSFDASRATQKMPNCALLGGSKRC